MQNLKNISIELGLLMSEINRAENNDAANLSVSGIKNHIESLKSLLDKKLDTMIYDIDINAFIENHQGLVWVKDLNGTFVAVNSLFAQYFETSKEEIIGKTDFDFFEGNEATVYRSHDERLIYTKQPFVIEETLELPLRKIVTETYKAPVFNSQNQVIGTIGFNRDITKLKKLEEQNRKLLKAIEQSTATIVITDTNGAIEYVNPQFTKLTGYSSSEAIGVNPRILKTEFTHPDTFKELWETISLGEEWHGEFCNRKKNGEIFWESAVISPVLDDEGKITNFIAVKEDVTDKKNAHDDLIRVSKLQDLLVKLALRNINLNSCELESNTLKSLCEISEFIEADRAIIFKYDWESEKCFCQYEWYSDNFGSVKNDLNSIDLIDIRSWVKHHKNKENHYIPDVSQYYGESAEILKLRGIKSLISVPFFIGDECVGFISFDSINKKHFYSTKENTLLEVFGQIYASLIQRFELEQTLKNETENAQKASQAKSEFLANMSHELRTPLNGVIGFSELLIQTNINDVQLQYATAINSSAKSLLNVINDILDFSKIEAGKLELEIVKCDMIQLIEHSIDIIKHSAEKKNLEILLNLPEYLPRFAYVDSIRVSQILINLLSNAVKFTNKGEVELKVNFCKTNEEVGSYTFSVRDTGIGISDNQKLKLFKAFSQADASTTRKFGGTGLGLSISDKLANKMGSSIQFESIPGEGSLFYFSVVANYESDSSLFNEKIENIKRVLVIDDNLNSRISIQKMLTNWGIETVICETASEAVFIMQMTTSFDLIIVDNFIHNYNGLESIRLICNKLNISVNSQNFLLLHAATDDFNFHNDCEQMGVKYLIEKPLRYDEVFSYLSAINVENKTSKKKNEPEINQLEISKKIKILIADDDVFNMMLAKAMITNIVSDVEIAEAINGKIAMEKVLASTYDIVFMDVQMPEMDGNEATKAIRKCESAIGKHTVIVGLTAGALKEEREKCLSSGMDEFLTKPIETVKLKETIERILGVD